MKNLVYLLLTLTFLISCKTKSIISSSQELTKDSTLDSIKERIVIKDTIIYLPGDTIPYQIPCDVDTAYIINSKLGSLQVQVNHGKVTGMAVINEKNLLIENIQRDFERYKETHKDTEVIKTKEVEVVKYRIPMYAVYHMVGFWILIILILYYFIRKKFLKI